MRIPVLACRLLLYRETGGGERRHVMPPALRAVRPLVLRTSL
jgi:hypothetical protein